MSVSQIGSFAIETMTWAADSEVRTRRTDRLIRACDPECYRLLLSVGGGNREEQPPQAGQPRYPRIQFHVTLTAPRPLGWLLTGTTIGSLRPADWLLEQASHILRALLSG